MRFLASYIQIVDGPWNAHHANFFSPSATIRKNAEPPILARVLARLLKLRSELSMTFEHSLIKAWAVSETDSYGSNTETLLLD